MRGLNWENKLRTTPPAVVQKPDRQNTERQKDSGLEIRVAADILVIVKRKNEPGQVQGAEKGYVERQN